MRTEEEVNNKLLECKHKRSFWRDRMWAVENNEEWEGQHDDYERSYRAWDERVKTLEYVLGHNNII